MSPASRVSPPSRPTPPLSSFISSPQGNGLLDIFSQVALLKQTGILPPIYLPILHWYEVSFYGQKGFQDFSFIILAPLFARLLSLQVFPPTVSGTSFYVPVFEMRGVLDKKLSF